MEIWDSAVRLVVSDMKKGAPCPPSQLNVFLKTPPRHKGWYTNASENLSYFEPNNQRQDKYSTKTRSSTRVHMPRNVKIQADRTTQLKILLRNHRFHLGQ